MRTLLICHADADLHREGLARWLASISTLAGVLVIHEDARVTRRRVRRELSRVGPLRLMDVLAFRLYYALVLARRDREWQEGLLAQLRDRFPALPEGIPVAHESGPNTAGAEEFIRACNPDLVLALCKNIIAERVFSIPPAGTFVLHPGICPEYRNAHGCFWALSRGDVEKVGMTLLRIDKGVDTGPVFGYFRYPFDEVSESHIVIQNRMVFDNLDAIGERLLAVRSGEANPLPSDGRASAVWGQPWLTRYLRWKRAARRRKCA
jgi:hypothetical protein